MKHLHDFRGLRRIRLAMLPVLILSIGAGVAHAQAQPSVSPVPVNVVHLSASGFTEIPQDWLSISLNTTQSGPDALTVQNQLKVALDAALTIARAAAQSQQLEVRTGQFSLYPRYSSAGKINGWQGSTEMVLEGRDFARISATAGRIQTLTMGNAGFSLSRQAQQKLTSDVQAQAIERFKERAAEVAASFGFAGYTLREISISSADQSGGAVRPRVMAMEAKAAMSDAPVPVEAGKSAVQVTVSGTIQLR